MNLKKLAIFGTGNISELAYFYFYKDSDYSPEVFVVDEAFKESDDFFGKPLISTETFMDSYSPSEWDVFIAVSYAKVNKVRSEKYKLFKSKGYNFASYISNQATVLTDDIGENCFILEDNTVQPYVVIGNNVYLWSGNHIGHHSVINDHCFISSHVVISGGCNIGEYSFIGVNATLRDHISIGRSNVIGAGTLILKDTEDDQVYIAKASEAAKTPSHRLRGI